MKDAGKVRSTIHGASSRCAEIKALISTDDTWSWARGKTLDDLNAASKAVREFMSAAPWCQEFLCAVDDNALKKKYGAEKCFLELNKFMEVGPTAERLATLTTRIFSAHEQLKF